MKLNAYGRKFQVIKENGQWSVYISGEGKRTRVTDFVIPAHFEKDEVLVFLADLFHEAATPENPDIIVTDEN